MKCKQTNCQYYYNGRGCFSCIHNPETQVYRMNQEINQLKVELAAKDERIKELKVFQIKYLAIRKQADKAHILLDKAKVPNIIFDTGYEGNSIDARLAFCLRKRGVNNG